MPRTTRAHKEGTPSALAGVGSPEPYDVIIVGAGVSGTALLYTLANYTDVKRILLLEKHTDVAQVSSGTTQNSQTLHFGDIESNYSFEKAKKVVQATEVLRHYIETVGKLDRTFVKRHKMLLAVGSEEVATLRERYEKFKTIFPKIELLEREAIVRYEPKVIEGRDPARAILALWSPDGYTMDYYALAKSFVKHVRKTGKTVDVRFSVTVKKITKDEKGGRAGYAITTADGTRYQTRVLVSDAGSMSIRLAKMLGYGKNLAIMSLAGNFYKAPETLRGKVYTMQHPKRPNAAIHGDPDIHETGYTRFGPSAKILFMLERRNYASVLDYFRSFNYTPAGIWVVIKTALDPAYGLYMLENYAYDVPWLGKRLLTRHVRKIVPTIKPSQIQKEKGYGATRPQVMDAHASAVNLGEARILGENAIFNITPSPGASTCLANAVKDAKETVGFLNAASDRGKKHAFDEKRFGKDHELAKAM